MAWIRNIDSKPNNPPESSVISSISCFSWSQFHKQFRPQHIEYQLSVSCHRMVKFPCGTTFGCLSGSEPGSFHHWLWKLDGILLKKKASKLFLPWPVAREIPCTSLICDTKAKGQFGRCYRGLAQQKENSSGTCQSMHKFRAWNDFPPDI